ncbi:MAG TPA: VWA domain-containing protein [Thermoanaerobaculia bacterium]|nr:VWA domain-containing protein [Thermoanaerobaculia bacterium]
MRKKLALSLLLILIPGVAYAQFGETVEVRVTNVDAIVTDKNGNPVSGLTKDDFEVYEDGVRQDITHFTEIADTRPGKNATSGKDGTSAAAAPQGEFRRRLIAVFVDLGSLEPVNRQAVLPKLQEFLTTNLRPGDAAVIYSWGDSLTVELQPTNDPAAIKAAVDKIATYTPERTTFWRGELEFNLERVVYLANIHRATKPWLDEGLEVTRRSAERAVAEMRQKTEAMKSILSQMRGQDGQKVLVLLTQSLGTNPAEEAFYYFYTQREKFIEGTTMRPRVEAKRFEVPGLAAEVAAAANVAGVTLYPLHTAGKFTEVSDVDATKGATVQMGAQPPRLLRRSTPEIDPRLLSLSAASDETGGRAIAGSGNWKGAFDAVSTELNAYYSLAYSAKGEREDRIREIEVRPKNKAYRVRTRRSLVEQTAASAMKDLVAAQLFQTRATNDLSVKAAIGTATAAGENLVHALTITIPTSTLTLTPDGTDLVGKFSVFAAFLRSDGAVSAVGPQVQQFRFPAASLPKRKEVTVKLDVTADAQVGAISLGVMDDTSAATGFALVKLPPAE